MLGRLLGRRARAVRENPYLNAVNWDYQKRLVEPLLKPGDIVLDVGCGNHPAPVANVLADFFPGESPHRTGPLAQDRPVVVCSVERLPFLDKSVDFAICSHVLEHTDSPERAAAELGRIARRGYLETPGYGKDILVGTGRMHNWQVVEFDGVLHFFQYSRLQREAHVQSPAMDLWLQKEYHPWQTFFWDSQPLFNAAVVWEGAPRLVVHRRASSDAAPVAPWKAPDPACVAAEPPALTPAEIALLGSCLATPDGRGRMAYSGKAFSDGSGRFVYPVSGKRIYCEMASGPAPADAPRDGGRR
jgi:SAM-dependent methyltransferase